MPSGKIYLIPNLIAPTTQTWAIPPGNLEIISQLSHFFVENTKMARRFISSLKLGLDISQLSFYEIGKKSDGQTLREGFKIVLEGQDAGIISDAGCPGIADPGARVVAWAHQQGIEVIPLVGPSSIFLALMASGMDGQSFAFHGYLPIAKGERMAKILDLEKQSFRFGQTQIFMETPYRNNALLADVLKHCRGNSLLALGVDIQAAEGFVKTKSIAAWKKALPDLHKKPTIFLLQAIK